MRAIAQRRQSAAGASSTTIACLVTFVIRDYGMSERARRYRLTVVRSMTCLSEVVTSPEIGTILAAARTTVRAPSFTAEQKANLIAQR